MTTPSSPWPARVGALLCTLALVLLAVGSNRELVWLTGVPTPFRRGLTDLPLPDLVGADWLPPRLGVPLLVGVVVIGAAWGLALVAACRAAWSRILVTAVVSLAAAFLVVVMLIAVLRDDPSGGQDSPGARALGLAVAILAPAALLVLLLWRWRRAARWAPLLAAGAAVAGLVLFLVAASGPAGIGPGVPVGLAAALVSLIGALVVTRQVGHA